MSDGQKILNKYDLVYFNMIVRSCIDRAAETAFQSVPEARAKQIKKKISECKASLPSPEIFEQIVGCTATKEDERDQEDESSRIFTAVFLDEFVRLAGVCLSRSVRSTKLLHEQVVIYFCMSVCANDPGIDLDHICPYHPVETTSNETMTEFFPEKENVLDSSWKCIALQMITVGDKMREVNAMAQFSEFTFIRKAADVLRRE